MPQLATALERHRHHLWGICYRMTGDAAEAEDLVQEAFARALDRPPSDLEAKLRPWLTRVATNLTIDHLRRRQHQAYTGPWLPAPVASQALLGLEQASEGEDLEQRYGVLESASFAFLEAATHLEPRARAVLILADVVGHTAPEIAELLELGPANVRQILSRSRAQLRELGLEPGRAGPRPHSDTTRALQAFMAAISSGDLNAITQLLTEAVEFRSDSAGEFRSATKVVAGAGAVAQLVLGISRRGSPPSSVSIIEVNGTVGLALRWSEDQLPERQAPRALLRLDLERQGQGIDRIGLVVASRKLSALSFD